MATLLLALAVTLLAVGGLALGLLARRPLKGSCGGLGCAACGRKCRKGQGDA